MVSTNMILSTKYTTCSTEPLFNLLIVWVANSTSGWFLMHILWIWLSMNINLEVKINRIILLKKLCLQGHQSLSMSSSAIASPGRGRVGAISNIFSHSNIRFKLKSRKIPFAPIFHCSRGMLLKICTEQSCCRAVCKFSEGFRDCRKGYGQTRFCEISIQIGRYEYITDPKSHQSSV